MSCCGAKEQLNDKCFTKWHFFHTQHSRDPPPTHTFSFLQTKTLISIIVKKMKCITDKSENEMKDRAKAGTGEY